MTTLPPWQAEAWRRCVAAADQDRVGHALLLSGAQGLGVEAFADHYAHRLLCNGMPPEARPCGECRPCVLFTAGNHPDFVLIEPEEDKKQIGIDAIRELIDFIHLSSQFGHYKIALIRPADAMTHHAANTLLKTLEEPPGQSVIMLLTTHPARLPATLRSRCQHVEFFADTSPETAAWLATQLHAGADEATQLLARAGGAPLRALELAESGELEQRDGVIRDLVALPERGTDPVEAAKRWHKLGAERVFPWLLSILGTLAGMRLGGESAETPDAPPDLQAVADELDLAGLVACYDLVLRNFREATGTMNVNQGSLLEEVAIFWKQAFSKQGV